MLPLGFIWLAFLLFSSKVLIFTVWSVKSLKDDLQLETAEQLLQDLDDYLETMEIFVSQAFPLPVKQN